jgi:hypothetical protein
LELCLGGGATVAAEAGLARAGNDLHVTAGAAVEHAIEVVVTRRSKRHRAHQNAFRRR